MRRLATFSIALSTLIAARPAAAVNCATVTLTDAQDDVIIGEAGTKMCYGGPSPGCFFMPYSPARLGVCRRVDGAAWQMQIVSTCTTSSTSSDYFSLNTLGGDDRVAVLKDEHTYGYLDLLPAGGGLGAMGCGNGNYLAPWNPNFDFTMNASLGTGTDLFHGSDNRDVVWTNGLFFIGGVLTSPADNSSVDQVCTWAGNDTIYGDRDDNYSAGFEDLIDGGTGTDTCDGDYGVDGNDVSDVLQSCETASDGWVTASYFDCSDSDDPLHDW